MRSHTHCDTENRGGGSERPRDNEVHHEGVEGRGHRRQDLMGGTAKQNAKIIEDILSGEDTGPKRDMVALNASAAFVVSGIATDIRNGLEIAREILEEGKAQKVLEMWRDFT